LQDAALAVAHIANDVHSIRGLLPFSRSAHMAVFDPKSRCGKCASTCSWELWRMNWNIVILKIVGFD
jgi:hypothetical protein